MYYCDNCKREFDEPNKKIISCEEYYGVDSQLSGDTKMELETCPYCDNEDIENMVACDRCGEFFREEDLVDTDELVGGRIGYICDDCARDCEVCI